MVDTSSLEGIRRASGTPNTAGNRPPSTAPRGGGGGGVTPPAPTAVDVTDPEAEVATGPMTAEEEADIRKQYPQFGHLLDDPELRLIFAEAVRKKWLPTELQGALEATDWFQSTGAAEREYESRSIRDPASLKRDLDQRKFMLEAMTKSYGVRMDDAELTELATNILRYGYSEQEILRFVADKARSNITSSDGMLAIQQQLKTMTRAYHLEYDDATLKEYATRIFEGTWSEDAAKATFQTQASTFYPHLRTQLEQGVTVEEYFTPIKARVASTLQMSPADIDLRKGKWQSLTQFIDDKGTMRAPTFGEVEQWARDQDEYGYTKEAIDGSYQRMYSVLEKMGAIR